MRLQSRVTAPGSRRSARRWLRCGAKRRRAESAGAERRTGTFEKLSRDDTGVSVVSYRPKGAAETVFESVKARCVIGADGANSGVGKQAVPGADKTPFVFAYHEIIKSPTAAQAAVMPKNGSAFDGARCDVFYHGTLSPDFYAWIFPHGDTVSVGTGSAHKGFSLRSAVGNLRELSGLAGTETIRREGAPIPLRPAKRWDNGRDVILADAADQFLVTGDARALATARKRFMKAHGTVFWVLGMMQHFWYKNDKRREKFVHICRDEDVQQLTWQSYMHKELVRTNPVAHVKIFFKDLAHLCGIVAP